MKTNFKTILIVFLVALLGAAVGTFGVIELKNDSNNGQRPSVQTTINTVNYPEIIKGDYSKAIEKAYDSVIEIQSTIYTQSFFGIEKSYGLGSGVIISEDGYVVTNNHVINGSKEVIAKMHDGTQIDVEVIGSDAKSDIAVLKLNGEHFKPVNIADSSQLILGEEAVVIGNPLGEGITCSNGIISCLEKEITINDFSMNVIQTNAAVNEGNSGGGLFNMNGDLIGIVNAKSYSSGYAQATIEGMGYAIPSNKVKDIVNDLIAYGYVKARPALGITVYSNQTYTNGTYEGLMISSVIPNGAADKAGLRKGDIICKINDKQITSYAVLSKILDSYKIGDSISAMILRNNQIIVVDIILQETKID